MRTTPGGPLRSIQHSSDLTPAERAALFPFRFTHPLLRDVEEDGDDVQAGLNAVIPEVINLAVGDDDVEDGGGEDQEGGARAGRDGRGDQGGDGHDQ